MPGPHAGSVRKPVTDSPKGVSRNGHSHRCARTGRKYSTSCQGHHTRFFMWSSTCPRKPRHDALLHASSTLRPGQVVRLLQRRVKNSTRIRKNQRARFNNLKTTIRESVRTSATQKHPSNLKQENQRVAIEKNLPPGRRVGLLHRPITKGDT